MLTERAFNGLVVEAHRAAHQVDRMSVDPRFRLLIGERLSGPESSYAPEPEIDLSFAPEADTSPKKLQHADAAPGEWEEDLEMEGVFWREGMVFVNSPAAYIWVSERIETMPKLKRPKVLLFSRQIMDVAVETHPFDWGRSKEIDTIAVENGRQIPPSSKRWLSLLK